MQTLNQGRLRSQAGHSPRSLTQGWQMLGTAPGLWADSSLLDDAQPWIAVPELGPVADV